MKIIFFYIGTPTPIFETELELIRKHEKLGDSVRVIQCTGNLPNCHWNLNHRNSKCALCCSKFKNGWDILNPGGNVELKTFPSNTRMDPALPLEFDSVDDINMYQHDKENIGFGVTASLVSILRDHRFDTKKHYAEVNHTLSTAIQVYDTLKHEIEGFGPDKVFFFNGRIATHLPAKLLCKKLGIEYCSYEVSRKKNCYRLFDNKTAHDVITHEEVNQFQLSWRPENEIIGKTILQQMRAGGPLEKTRVYTQDQRKGVLPEGFNPNKRNIAIFTGTIDEYAGIENAKNKIYKPDETAGVCRILESFEFDSDYFFYLRVHPHMKEVPSTIAQLTDIRRLSTEFNNVHVIWPEEIIDSYALMDACEKIVTFGSTVGIEATYWGKPSVLADHATFENFNYAYKPDNHDELVKLLKDNLTPLPADLALKVVFLMSFDDGIPYKYFKDIGIKNELAIGTFDSVEIKSDMLPTLWHWIDIFPSRLLRVFMKPSLIFKKLKESIKTLQG
ncbi:MAG: hypothetical protein OEW99_00325 [Gammaproteobacteria bacterium]|nr:hypothetical protein [Gammaproteobacteria bacterium]